MLTNNFKNIVVKSGCLYYSGWYTELDVSLANSLYLVDMNNTKMNLGNNISKYWSFFFGGCETSAIRMIGNYDNLETMISAGTYFIRGARQETYTIGGYNGDNSGAGMIILGSGDTPPTPDDYKLDSWIPTTELYAISYGVILPKTREDDFIGGFTATYYNASQENKTIKEIGVIAHGTLEANWNSRTKILMARDIFENPIIIKPKEGCTFSFLIK